MNHFLEAFDKMLQNRIITTETQFTIFEKVPLKRLSKTYKGFNLWVYILFYKGKVVYIGESINVFNRISQHRYDKGKNFDSVMTFNFNQKYSSGSIERRAISLFNPIYNIVGTPRDIRPRKTAARNFGIKVTTKIDDQGITYKRES